MSIEQEDYKQVVEAAQRLPREQRQRLIEELARGLDDVVTPLTLIGTWKGVSLTADEIDETRRECWAGFGEDE